MEVPLEVTMKDSKKVEVGKRLAEFNCQMKEELTQAAKAKENGPKLIVCWGCHSC